MTNKKLLALLGLTLLVGFSACKDDDIVKGSPADEGDEVNFGAQLNDPKSRTYYGEKADGAFPIYWNTEVQGFDKIFIYAPDAMAGRNQAYYTVRPTTADQTTPAAVVKVGDTGIQWSDKATKFYGFYPGNENFNISSSGNTVTATLPGDQTITFVDENLDNNTTTNYQFETTPDMSCVMMVAQTPDAINPTTDAVGLQFEPLSTVIDVTVCGPKEGNTTNPYRVTSVSLISETEQLCGEFTYNFDTKQIETQSEISEANKMITVRTMGMDSQGNYVGVPLLTGQTMNVKISMLPNVNVSSLKVQVTTADSKIWTKTLNTTNLAPGQINPVTLPQLEAEAAKLDYSRWISQLDPRIYVSEVSLPGSALAFNIDGYMASGNENQCTQFGTLDQQFAAGIRAFQGHFWMIPGESPIDHKEGQFVLTTSNGNNTGISLMYACQRLQEEMEKAHSHGFCVLLLSDYEIGGTSYNISQVYDRFQDVTAELQRRNILAPDITPTTTLADVRGKIILKLQLNGDEIENGGVTNTNPERTNIALRNLQTAWSALAISGNLQTKSLFNIWTSVAGSNVFYSPMTFGTIGSYSFTNASRDWVTLPPAWNYTPAVITQITPGIAVEAAKIWASKGGATETGDLNCTSRPDMSDGNNMWYIYTEQANAGSYLSQCETNITNMVSTIRDTYTGQLYNKFYMTYVGGAGTSYGETVKNRLNAKWLSDTQTASEVGQNYPLGWVMFNDATDHFTGGTLTRTCIERVINQNTKEGFILERDRTQPITPAAAPKGDVKGVSNGGSIF